MNVYRRPKVEPTCTDLNMSAYGKGVGGDENEGQVDFIEKKTQHQPERPTRMQRAPPSPSALDTLMGSLLLIAGHIIFVICFPILVWSAVRIVLDYERLVLFRLGKIVGGALGPGPIFINPLIDTVQRVDMRTVTFDVPPQEVLTKDSVTVAVDAVVYFRVFEPTASVLNVMDADRATKLLSQTTLRNLLGTLSLSDILAQREHISSQMRSQLDEATDPWGIEVERVEIKDVKLPKELQRAMAAEAEASREAKAKVIAAEGEYQASQSLQAAAEVIGKTPSALHLRYLQTLNTISAEKNSTVIFPFPIEILKNFPNQKGLLG